MGRLVCWVTRTVPFCFILYKFHFVLNVVNYDVAKETLFGGITSGVAGLPDKI